MYFNWGDHVRLINVSPDSKIYIESNSFKTDKLILKKSYTFSEFFETFFTEEELLNILKLDYRNIRYFSQKLITPNIRKFLTPEIVISCIENNHKCFEYIPENLLSKDLCEYFLTKDYLLYIKFIPNNFLTTTQYYIKQILIYYIYNKNYFYCKYIEYIHSKR